jgi:site-specific DNA recombinase
MRAQAPRKGREFRRVSVDLTGKVKSNEEQGEENGPCAERHNVALTGEPYEEVGSASKFAKKKRGDDFLKLMKDLESGRFTADGSEVLWMWESSRGSRRTGVWCSLIDACEDAGVNIGVTTHDRIYDTSNARDRRSLQEDAVDSEYESAKTSMRVTRDVEAAVKAEGGARPHGRRPYGYEREYNMSTKKMIRQYEHPEQGPLLRQAVKGIIAGELSLAQAAVLTGMSVSGFQSAVLSPTYLAKRVHKGVTYDGDWPALLTAREQQALAAIFALTRRGPRSTPKMRWPYTPILRCEICKGKLTSRWVRKYGKERRAYSCQTRKCSGVSVDAVTIDKIIDAALQDKINRGHVIDETVDPEVAALMAEQEKLEAHLVILDEQGSEPGADVAKLLKWSATSEKRLAEVKAELALLVGPVPDVEQWKGKVVADMEHAEKAILVKEFIRTLTVRPVNHHRGVPIEDRIDIAWN